MKYFEICRKIPLYLVSSIKVLDFLINILYNLLVCLIKKLKVIRLLTKNN